MSTQHDWLPQNHEELHEQSSLTKNYTDGNMGNFGLDGKSATAYNNGFKAKWTIYDNVYGQWINPATRTPVVIAAFKDAEAEMKTAYREFYIGYLKNNLNVTDADLAAMGLPTRSTAKPAPNPAPATYPDLTIEPDGIRTVRLHFRDHDKKTTGKPHGVIGAVIRWAVLPEPPIEVEDMTNTLLDTRTPYVFAFEESQRGQTLYCAAAWQNTKGEKGRWSEIVNTIIP